MNSKNYKNAVMISEAFMNLPEVKAAKRKGGARALGLIVETLRAMRPMKNGLLPFTETADICTEAHIRRDKLFEWFRTTELFRVDETHHLIYIPHQRILINKPADPTPEEIEDIRLNGCIYKGTPRSKGRKSRADAALSPSDEQNINNSSSVVKVASLQSADNKPDGAPLIPTPTTNTVYDINPTDNNIINKPVTLTNNKKCENTGKEKEEDLDDEKNFNFFKKKIFSSKKWTDSVSLVRGIKLYDAKVANRFACWMYSYCVSKNKMPADVKDLQNYAFWLLDKSRSTRKMIDAYLEKKEQQEEEERTARERAEFLKEQNEKDEQKMKEERERYKFIKEYNNERIVLDKKVQMDQQKINRMYLIAKNHGEEAERKRIEALPCYKNTGYKCDGSGYLIEVEGYLRAPGNYKNIVPRYAIIPPNDNLKWSYIHDDWIAPEDFDSEKEYAELDRLKAEIHRKRVEREKKREKHLKDVEEAKKVKERLRKRGILADSIYDSPIKFRNIRGYKKGKSPKYLFCVREPYTYNFDEYGEPIEDF